MPRTTICCGAEPYIIVRESNYIRLATVLDAHGLGSPYAIYGFDVQMAEIEVDPLMGRANMGKVAAVQDVGKAINPMLVGGQIEVAIAQGLVSALMEEFGLVLSSSFGSHAVLPILDIPQMEVSLGEVSSSTGPHGARRIGELPINPNGFCNA